MNLNPTVYNCLMSPILQTPLVMLKNTKGTISIFKSLRNISPNGFKVSAAFGEMNPIARPITIPINIFFPNDNFLNFPMSLPP